MVQHPTFGINGNYEGVKAEQDLDGRHVFRLDPSTAELRQMTDDFIQPNGLAFDEDWTTLYVVDQSVRAHIRALRVSEEGLTEGREVATCTSGRFDGIKLDSLGRIWAAAEDGVHCLSPEGELLGKLLLPEVCSGLCFGGRRLNQLFVTGASALYSIRLAIEGLR